VFVIIILELLLRLLAAPVEIVSCDCFDFFGDAKFVCVVNLFMNCQQSVLEVISLTI